MCTHTNQTKITHTTCIYMCVLNVFFNIHDIIFLCFLTVSSTDKSANSQGKVRPKKYRTARLEAYSQYQTLNRPTTSTCTCSSESTPELQHINYVDNQHPKGASTQENTEVLITYETPDTTCIYMYTSDKSDTIASNDTNTEMQQLTSEALVSDNLALHTCTDSDIGSILHEILSEDSENEDSGLSADEEGEDNEDISESEEASGYVYIPEDINKESPVYPGHYMSLKDSVLLIWLFITTHSLTAQQSSDLLALINLHLLVQNPVLKSLYRFKQFFDISSPLQRHYYCTFCMNGVNKDDKVCGNNHCLRDLAKEGASSYFLELPVEHQLKKLFKKESFSSSLQHKWIRNGASDANIKDIYDGHVYKQLSKDGGPLSEKYPYNISVTINTDGVPVFKSSNSSVWPVFLMVNELPFHLRRRKENLILAGLWFGRTKPFMPTFCDVLHKSLMNLENNGVEVSIENGETGICKLFLICLSADIPAKSSIMNMNQHNGDSSCIKCLQPGQNVRTVSGGNVRVFPYKEEDPTGPKRNHMDCLKNANTALETGKTVAGIKGPSFLMLCSSFDYVKGTAIDYMHSVLLGVIRSLLKFWFGSSHACIQYIFNF